MGSVIQDEETIVLREPSRQMRWQKVRAPKLNARRLLALLFAMLSLALVVPPTPVLAHAALLYSLPADGAALTRAPASVEFVFGETVAPVLDGFQLYESSGGHQILQVDQLDATVTATLPPKLANGSYKLSWRVISDDSHPISGVLSFSVGRAGAGVPAVVPDASGGVDLLYGVLNAFGYLGLFVLIGLTAFDLFVARTTVAARPLPWVAGFLAISAYTLLVPLSAVRERGSGLGDLADPAVWGIGWSGGQGLTLVFALAGVLLMLLASRIPGAGSSWTATVGAGVALLSVLPIGHTQAYEPSWLVMGSDLVHAATAAVWLGGLVGLVLHLARARRHKGDPALAAMVLGRFSTLAGGLVVLLGISGTILAVVMVGSVATLVGSSYGRLLMVKLAIVAVIGGFAAWNRFGLLPRLVNEGIKGKAWSRLALAVRLEAIGIVMVLGLTSALTLQNPRTLEVLDPSGTEILVDLGTGHLTGTFSAGKAGTNVLLFTITDVGGDPLSPFSLPQVSVAEPNQSLGPLAATVKPGETEGSYQAEMDLPVAGMWKITVAVRINELEQPAAVIDVVVAK
ncbi:copper resistance protein CopC [Arthrobacter sp. lap29]|uniref:copper resistance CopC/CopD family protein n=1 Tax=Arthrobacter sp. lap29 TaxID=3056122 RepID=UPI0028F6F4F0|nr:copper resistance protein CopC [Arthrobacter sp. lap29]